MDPQQSKPPVFPLEPEKITERRIRTYQVGDFQTAAKVRELVELMWLELDTEFSYYHPVKTPAEPALLASYKSGEIRMDNMERRFYRHPGGGRLYVQISPPTEGTYAWPWMAEVVERGPEYWRQTMTLSPRRREELDTWRKVELEEQYRERARKARYRYDIFLSYATADSEEAKRLHDLLTAAGRRVFMAPKVLMPGDDFAEEIRLALIGARELWLLLSPASAKSEWVISEWGAAWALGKRITPILHRCPPEALPARLARFQCTDLHRVGDLLRGPNPPG